jgi:hypothetical protein
VLSSVLCDREGRLRAGPLFLLLFCLVLVLFLFFSPSWLMLSDSASEGRKERMIPQETLMLYFVMENRD